MTGYEKIKNLRLIGDPFTIENELLTPKMSLKRFNARKIFEKEIKEMYEEGIIEI